MLNYIYNLERNHLLIDETAKYLGNVLVFNLSIFLTIDFLHSSALFSHWKGIWEGSYKGRYYFFFCII